MCHLGGCRTAVCFGGIAARKCNLTAASVHERPLMNCLGNFAEQKELLLNI